jgi:broad specificity phosphatase PhoE
MLRTLQTAEPVGQALDLPVEVWVEIHEHGGMFMDYGDERGSVGLPGLTRADMLAQFAGYVLPDAVTEQGWWNPASGIEDITGCQARAIRVAGALRSQAASAQQIALVTHGTFADCLIKAFLNMLPGDDKHFQHYNTGITRLDFRADGRVYLRYVNRIEHLSPELVS